MLSRHSYRAGMWLNNSEECSKLLCWHWPTARNPPTQAACESQLMLVLSITDPDGNRRDPRTRPLMGRVGINSTFKSKNASFQRYRYGGGAIVHAQLAKGVQQMGFDRSFADFELARNLFVGKALGY